MVGFGEEYAIMCFINTKTNGCLGRRKDAACVFVLGGVGAGQIASTPGGWGGWGGGGGRKSLSYNSSITCLLPALLRVKRKLQPASISSFQG